MVPERRPGTTTTGLPAVQWKRLTQRQQQALTNELVRLLCQYVQGERGRAVLAGNREVDDDGPTQDR
jgi:hypothetical protein